MGIPSGISFTYGEVFRAYEDCLKNKKNTANAIEYMRDAVVNNIRLADEINSGEYEIGKSLAFCVTMPKIREVFAADFRDRIVHHLVINELMPLFEKTFIPDSYSCMKGRGVLYGVRRMFGKIWECTRGYTRDAWVLKMDLRAFFMSIDKDGLARYLDNYIVRFYPENRKKGMLRELCRKIVLHHPELNCEKRGDRKLWERLPKEKSLFSVAGNLGLPIGNLTSQIFANLYLHPLDLFVTRDLGFRYYGRYVDDFVIVSEDRERLLGAIGKIEDFVRCHLRLEVNPRKIYFQHYRNGLSFIGAVLKRGRHYIGKRTRGNLWYRLWKGFGEVEERKAGDLVCVVNSYLGFMVHHSSYNVRKSFFGKGTVLDRWRRFAVPADGYRKVVRVRS